MAGSALVGSEAGTASETLSSIRIVEPAISMPSEDLAPVVPIGRPVTDPLPRLGFTREETAAVMGVSPATVDRMVRGGLLKPFRFGKVLLCTREAIMDCLTSGGDAA